MSLWETGVYINGEVRKFFKQGHKSNNKVYDDGFVDSVDSSEFQVTQEKSIRRWQRQKLAIEHVVPAFDTYYERAKFLLRVPAADRAGNCSEMAALSAWYALKRNIARNCIYVGVILPPGDHAFCLISIRPIEESRRTFPSVRKFSKSFSRNSRLIVDPWLNTVCLLENYLLMAGRKLNDWSAEGKRVAYWHGSQGAGWYPPGGEYREQLGNAPVTLYPF